MTHLEAWQVEQRLGSSHLPVQNLCHATGRESKSGLGRGPSPECPLGADGKDESEAVPGDRTTAWSSRSLLESCRQEAGFRWTLTPTSIFVDPRKGIRLIGTVLLRHLDLRCWPSRYRPRRI
jgi:hypothetical protein